jgi:hypothetical protein
VIEREEAHDLGRIVCCLRPPGHQTRLVDDALGEAFADQLPVRLDGQMSAVLALLLGKGHPQFQDPIEIVQRGYFNRHP